MIMRCKPIVTGLVLSSIVFAPALTQAQVIVDVSKITCDQYVHAKITSPKRALIEVYQTVMRQSGAD
jgi:hypothetical protein